MRLLRRMERRELSDLQKPKRANGLSVAKAADVPLVVAPDDKVSTVQKCTNISQEVVPVRADNSVDRICKAKPSSNTDHPRSQARNCSLLDTDLRSSGTSFTDNVQDRSSREETDFRNSSLL